LERVKDWTWEERSEAKRGELGTRKKKKEKKKMVFKKRMWVP